MSSQLGVYRALMLANYGLASAGLYVDAPKLDLGPTVGKLNSISVARGLAVGAASGVVGADFTQYVLLTSAHAALDAGLSGAFPETFGETQRTVGGTVVEIGIGALGFVLGKSLWKAVK